MSNIHSFSFTLYFLRIWNILFCLCLTRFSALADFSFFTTTLAAYISNMYNVYILIWYEYIFVLYIMTIGYVWNNLLSISIYNIYIYVSKIRTLICLVISWFFSWFINQCCWTLFFFCSKYKVLTISRDNIIHIALVRH